MKLYHRWINDCPIEVVEHLFELWESGAWQYVAKQEIEAAPSRLVSNSQVRGIEVETAQRWGNVIRPNGERGYPESFLNYLQRKAWGIQIEEPFWVSDPVAMTLFLDVLRRRNNA